MAVMRLHAAMWLTLALGACGTHESVAPVVYGSQPNATARVYNSPQEARAQRAATAQPARYAPDAKSAPSTGVDEVRLQPVSAIYLSDEERAAAKQRAASTSAPERRHARAPGRTVTVQKGDTVYALGRRYNVHPKDIIAVNNLRPPHHLSVGQKIVLPAGASSTSADGAPAASVAATKPVAPKPVMQTATYTVRKGDTLHSISRKTGVPVSRLATANRLGAPYAISPGQVLLTPGAQQRSPKVAAASTEGAAPAAGNVEELTKRVSYTTSSASDALFAWPVRGAIISEYGVGELGRRNDGINIAAPAGTPVRAAADGEVVYRGSELDGFGNLLLVKHTDGFVTAYAHNDAMLVKKGDVVRKGQVIAKVGQTGSVTTPQLHFEIRQKLKSVDPLALLDKP